MLLVCSAFDTCAGLSEGNDVHEMSKFFHGSECSVHQDSALFTLYAVSLWTLCHRCALAGLVDWLVIERHP